ncbi:type II CAAX endopeptidase family protein [Terribacillus saccharophilus]|uniref:CPBP family intramembrane glutamic endopeptidase n=1 Tax=Terribacillus saccharophilus TaxID=361277 RepID=UPI0039819750
MRKLLSTIVKTIIFFVGWAVLISFTPDLPTANQALMRIWWEFTPLAAVILFSICFVYLIERGKIKVPVTVNLPKNLLTGIVIGIIWLGSVAAILLLTKTMHIQGVNPIAYFWIWVLASLLNTVMQELLVRGYLYQLWKRKYNTITAAVLTTILFTAMHGGAFEAGIIPVLNIISMSLLVTMLLEYTGTIIAPILAHFIWNTVGAIILGGVSLASDYPHLLNSTYQGKIAGGVLKMEGSILVLIVNLILFSYLFISNRKSALATS